MYLWYPTLAAEDETQVLRLPFLFDKLRVRVAQDDSKDGARGLIAGSCFSNS